jgi:hypothetical protein
LLSGPSAWAAEGCPYLTDEDVETATGEKLDLFKLEALPLPDGKGMVCESPVAGVIVLSGPDSAQRFLAMAEQNGRTLGDGVPVLELGADARAVFLEPRNENERPTSLVIVNAEDSTAVVSVKAPTGSLQTDATAAELTAQAVALAKIVMTKLP